MLQVMTRLHSERQQLDQLVADRRNIETYIRSRVQDWTEQQRAKPSSSPQEVGRSVPRKWLQSVILRVDAGGVGCCISEAPGHRDGPASDCT